MVGAVKIRYLQCPIKIHILMTEIKKGNLLQSSEKNTFAKCICFAHTKYKSVLPTSFLEEGFGTT